VSEIVTLAVWAVLAVAFAGLVVASHTRPERVPTIGMVLSWLTGSAPGRWFVLLGWAWLGWHVFVR
jgi:Family of unknown function (DUF6186)